MEDDGEGEGEGIWLTLGKIACEQRCIAVLNKND